MSKRIGIRVSKEEFKLIKEIADSEGLSVSRYIRGSIVNRPVPTQAATEVDYVEPICYEEQENLDLEKRADEMVSAAFSLSKYVTWEHDAKSEVLVEEFIRAVRQVYPLHSHGKKYSLLLSKVLDTLETLEKSPV